jgi:hypothetical protein
VGDTIGVAIHAAPNRSLKHETNIRCKDVHFLIRVKKPEIDRDFRMK